MLRNSFKLPLAQLLKGLNVEMLKCHPQTSGSIEQPDAQNETNKQGEIATNDAELCRMSKITEFRFKQSERDAQNDTL